MEANFFKQLAGLDITGDLQLTVSKATADTYVVSVMLQNPQCGDEARKRIPPLNVRGTAQELDEGFFGSITAPIEAASGLMVDMEGYLKQLGEVKKHSAMEKEKSGKEKKETDAKDKKYREAMQKAGDLETEGKFREAWSKVPNPSDYPEYAEEIKKRRAALSARFDEGSLFDEHKTETVEP